MTTLTIKVGQMPGKLVEVVAETGSTAREMFELAGVEVSNHEVRLDGSKISLDTKINSGNLLVAMKMIKGNMPTIKVGQMPGKLVEVVYENGMSAEEIFKLAEVEVSNHEVRLDGTKISLSTSVSNGNLLVAMKMIKGNKEVYKTELTEKEVSDILGVELRTIIPTEEVMEIDDECVLVDDYIIEQDMFDSVYKLTEEQETIDIQEVEEEVMHECKCNKGRKFVEDKLEELRKDADFYWKQYKQVDVQIEVLEEVLKNM